MPVEEIAERMKVKEGMVRHYVFVARHFDKLKYAKSSRRRKKNDASSLRFYVGKRPRKNGGRLWLQNVFRKHDLYGRKVSFKSKEERIRFLLAVFSKKEISGPRKHVLTRWLREENMLSKEEVEEFYRMLQQNSPQYTRLPRSIEDESSGTDRKDRLRRPGPTQSA